jgi:hypothetical protein
MQIVRWMRQSDILVQLHLPSVTQLKKMGTQCSLLLSATVARLCCVMFCLHAFGICRVGLPCKLLSITDLQSDSPRFKGHGMLAPFTAGWQSNDLHPLIIERSEVATLNFSIIFFTTLKNAVLNYGEVDLERRLFYIPV